MKSIILAVGTGRDGTTTLYKIIEKIFKKNDHPGISYHQKDHRYIYNEYCSFRETGYPKHLDNIKRKIKNWQIGNAIIGNGYAPVLDIIHDIHKNSIKLIHIKRKKETWINSFVENVNTFPWSHGNYSGYANPKIRRIAAFHYGELTREEWHKLSLKEKASWYYDKTHDLIDSYKHLFKNHIDIMTESLSNEVTIKKITKFIDKDWKSIEDEVRVNVSKIDYKKLAAEDRVIISRFYSGFDYVHSAKNPIDGEEYFNNKIIEGFLNRETYVHNAISIDDLQIYLTNLRERISYLESLIKREKKADRGKT